MEFPSSACATAIGAVAYAADFGIGSHGGDEGLRDFIPRSGVNDLQANEIRQAVRLFPCREPGTLALTFFGVRELVCEWSIQ